MNMRVDKRSAAVALPFDVLDVLMPMHAVIDADGRIRHVGPTLHKMLDGASVVGAALLDMFELRQPADISDFSSLKIHAGARLSLVLKDADQLPLRAVIMPLPGEDGMILDISLGLSFSRAVSDFSLTLRDFSPCDQTIELLYLHEANSSTARLSRHLSERLQAAHDAAQHQARTDVLTGLNNRRAMDDELEYLLVQRSHDFTLMQMDLDHFKFVNDTYGHAAGDAVLVEVGRILNQEVRRTDFPARVGGDEFLLILRPSLSEKLAARIAERLIERIEAPISVDGHTCRISASIGIATTTQYPNRPTAGQLVADVDGALYQAKNAGRGCYRIANGGGRVPSP